MSSAQLVSSLNKSMSLGWGSACVKCPPLDLEKESAPLLLYALQVGKADSPRENDPFLVSQRRRSPSRQKWQHFNYSQFTENCLCKMEEFSQGDKASKCRKNSLPNLTFRNNSVLGKPILIDQKKNLSP